MLSTALEKKGHKSSLMKILLLTSVAVCLLLSTNGCLFSANKPKTNSEILVGKKGEIEKATPFINQHDWVIMTQRYYLEIL